MGGKRNTGTLSANVEMFLWQKLYKNLLYKGAWKTCPGYASQTAEISIVTLELGTRVMLH